MVKKKSSVKINKKPMKKKAKKAVPKTKKVSTPEKSDSFEIPVSKLIMVFTAIAIIALLVFAGTKLFNRTDELVVGPEGIAAMVNGQEITWEKIDKQYDTLSESYKQVLTREVLLNQSIDEALLMEQVEEKNIETNQDDLDSLVARVESQFTEEELALTLENQGMTMEDFIQQLENRLLVNALLEQEIEGMEITEEEIQAYFEENKDLLDTPDMIRASHILVETREEAEDILVMIDEGSEFADLALEYSLDGSSQTGGDLGYFPEGVMVPEFEEAAFSLEVGEVSDVVETQYGYHLIFLTDKKAAAESDIEDLRSTIKFNLFDLKLRSNQDKFNSYIVGLREQAEIEIFAR